MMKRREIIFMLCPFILDLMQLTLVLTLTDCYSGLEDITCQQSTNSSSIFYNNRCVAIHAVCSKFGYLNGGNTTHCFTNDDGAKAFSDIMKRILSSEEYFR